MNDPEELQQIIKALSERWDELSDDNKQIVRTLLMLNEQYPLPTGEGKEKQTCPRRAESMRIEAYEGENLDWWETDRWCATEEEGAKKKAEYEAKNPDSHAANQWWQGPGPMPRTCSYCGGLNPEDAVNLKKNFGWTVEVAKSYKAYMHPPGYEMGLLEWQANVGAGVDSTEALEKRSGNKWTPTPPAKAYMQHFTQEQVDELK